MGQRAGGDDGVTQDHGVGLSVQDPLRAPQAQFALYVRSDQRRAGGQMPARRKTADGDPPRVQPQFIRMAAQVQHRPGSVCQRGVAQRGFAGGVRHRIIQQEHLVARGQELGAHRVGFPVAAAGVTAAGQDEHRRADVIIGHGFAGVPHPAPQPGAAGQGVFIQLHGPPPCRSGRAADAALYIPPECRQPAAPVRGRGAFCNTPPCAGWPPGWKGPG